MTRIIGFKMLTWVHFFYFLKLIYFNFIIQTFIIVFFLWYYLNIMPMVSGFSSLPNLKWFFFKLFFFFLVSPFNIELFDNANRLESSFFFFTFFRCFFISLFIFVAFFLFILFNLPIELMTWILDFYPSIFLLQKTKVFQSMTKRITNLV
jgi:hypothetical protein